MNNFYRKIIYLFFLCLGVFNFPFGIEKAIALECGSTHYNCVGGYPFEQRKSGSGGPGWGLCGWYWTCTETALGGGAGVHCAEPCRACVHDVCGEWSACGSNGVKSRVCSASDTNDCSGYFSVTETQPCPVAGTCGTANLKTYAYNITSYGSDTQCATGNSTNTAFPSQGGIVGWYCNGLNGGANSDLCAASRNPAPVAGQCGTANLKTYSYDTTSYGTDTQCTTGTSTNTAFPNQGSVVGWYCNGLNGGGNSDLCAASRSSIPVNGDCGPAAKLYPIDATAYDGNQCLTGTPSNTVFPAKGETATWVCNGENGGTNSTVCFAIHSNIRPSWTEK